MKHFLFFTMLWLSFFGKAQQIKNVSATEFKELLDQKNYVLIDLRTPGEIDKKGMIEGAVQINYLSKDAEQQITALDKNKSYLIYCAGGGRSGECTEFMKAKGFSKVINLEKGFDDWKAKGYKTITVND